MVLELGIQINQDTAFAFYLGASKEDNDQLWIRIMRQLLRDDRNWSGSINNINGLQQCSLKLCAQDLIVNVHIFKNYIKMQTLIQ